jgi:hypothetical protein
MRKTMRTLGVFQAGIILPGSARSPFSDSPLFATLSV